MSRYDYTYTLGTNKEGFLKEIAQALGAADKEISKTNLTVKLLCSEKELKQQLDKLKGLNPEILTTITLDVSRDGLKQDVDLMTKVIRQEFKSNKSISQTIQQQIKAGLTGSDLKSTLQDMLNEVYGDGTKVNAKNVRKLVEDVQKNLNELDFSKSDTSLEAYEQITNLIEQYTKLSNLLSNKSAIKKEGLSTILDPKVLGFDFSEFQKAGDDFFQRSGDYINDHIQTLQTSIVKKYEQSAQTLYSNLKTFLMSNGNPIVAAFSINDAKNRSDQLKSQVQQATDEISKAMQEAQADISKYSNKGLEGLSESQASKLYTAVEVYKQLGGSMESVYDSMNTKAREWLKTELDATEDIRLTYADRAKQITTPLLNELSASEGELKAVSKFVTEMQDHIQQKVQEQAQLETAKVEIEPVISDPAAFVAKIEAQLANQIVKIAVEPAINSVAEFQELLRQQLPNEFVDVKFNLENGSTLSLDGILAQFDTLKEKIDSVKTELSNLETLSGNSAASIKSIFEHLTIQQPTNSTQFSEILRSIKQLQDNVDKDIDMDKVDRLVQALSKIGELAISPNIDLSKFSLGGINRYLDKTDNIKTLGKTLDVLADGLYSLNISLTDAKFSELKDFTISDEVLKNLPKFAKGLEGLGKKLQTFSSSATGVLSSINQILSQSKSLEYLYNLANSPNSSKQSNIVGNGLLNAFDKSAINTIQHPAGSTDEVAALAKEYQWLTSQVRTYFELSSKFAKGTINSNDAAKLMQLQRAMEGATQRMNQFQETDQSLITAQNDLSTALSQNGTAIETALVNNLNKAIDKIDETQAEALGFKDALDAVKAKVTDIQNAFSSNGLISSKEIENAEAVLKKALEDAKQLKADISAAQKKQDTEIKNSYKNILENYSLSALSKAGTNQPENDIEVQKLANEYDYLNQMVGKYIQLLKEDANSKSVNSERMSKIQALTQAYEAFISRQKAGVDTDALLQNSVSNLNASLSGMAKTLSEELTATLGSYIAKITDIKDETTKYAASIEKMKQAQATISSQLGDNTADFATLKNALDTYASGLNAYKSVLADITASERDATEAEKQALTLDIQKWMNKNTKAAAKYKEELAALLDQLAKVTDRSGLEAVQTSYLKLQNQAEKLKETGSAFGDVMKAKFKELSTYLMSFASFYQVVNILKQGISIAHEYDDAFTEMRKVTDSSTSSLKKFQKESFQLANQVGTTAEQLQQSTADWLRLGESFDEAKKSAQVSNVLLNVSEFENIDSATESLVAMSQAYQDLDKMDIVDKLNNVG